MPDSVPNFPPLAGLCSFEEAQRTALSVEDCVSWMKRHHYILWRLHEIFTSRITAEPIYELKTAFSHHAYLCAEHVTALRQRVSELREPPLGLETVPHEGLKLCLDEILAAPTHVELLHGIYGVVIPHLIASLTAYIDTTNPLADAPSVRIARFCRLEMEDLRAFGRQAIAALDSDRNLTEWINLLHHCLEVTWGHSSRLSPLSPVGERARERGSRDHGLSHVKSTEAATELTKTALAKGERSGALGPLSLTLSPETGARGQSHPSLTQPYFSVTPYHYDPIPQRDARFHDSYNGGVNPEAFLYDERFSPRDKTLMLFYKRLREIDVPEMMASIIHQTPGKPWGYYHDMSRQLWDEARHAMLGEVGFVNLGIDWSQIPINFTWSLNLNTQLTPQERHAVLFFIEQTLMPKTGKRFEWEVGQQSGNPLAALIQDFDWADEVLHAQIGREWYVKDFGDLIPALDYGDKCWSKVMSHWRAYRDQGLTAHRNWWPEVYREACKRWHTTPDPAALAFDTTYEDTRADLKNISASA